jgi:hypothetical protein
MKRVRSIFKLLAMSLAVTATPIVLLGQELLTRESRFEFATVAEGQALVATSDTFLKAMSRFDRQVRLQTDGEATEARLVEFLKEQVVEWDEESRTAVIEAIDRVRPKLDPFDLPLPKSTLFILTTGKDEGHAAYTRGPAILLPLAKMQMARPDALDRLVLHELFHVLSRNAPEFRRDLYRIIGFEICDPVPLPPSLADIKLTNPDAPLIDSLIRLTEGDETFHAAPILYSSSATYDAEKKPTLFKYVTFRLLRVEKQDGNWLPKLVDGKPVLITPADSKSFSDQIGQNTRYIIHPDEILADNFVHLVLQTEKLASPQIVERIGERLKRRPATQP